MARDKTLGVQHEFLQNHLATLVYQAKRPDVQQVPALACLGDHAISHMYWGHASAEKGS